MKSSNSSMRWFVTIALLVSVAACGGDFVADDGADDGADGGSDSVDGDGSDGTAGGGASSGGTGGEGAQPGAGGGPSECCLALALCNDGDIQIESEAACRPGARCYSTTVCCHTVWCEMTCDAVPLCLDGEVQVSTCPEGAHCTQRTHELCGTTVLCQSDAAACDREQEVHRDYVLDSPGACLVSIYSCPEHTTAFANDCGCGCEQPSECPDSVDCEPGASTDPLCDSDECPYSDRAL